VIGQTQRLIAERRRQREIEGRAATEVEATFEAELETHVARLKALARADASPRT
jgi:hypothetical protein